MWYLVWIMSVGAFAAVSVLTAVVMERRDKA